MNRDVLLPNRLPDERVTTLQQSLQSFTTRPCSSCSISCLCSGSETCTCGCTPHCIYMSTALPQDMSSLEPQIQPLVFILSKLQVYKTNWSCQGHVNGNGEVVSVPEVSFSCKDHIFAEILHRALFTLYEDELIEYPWVVQLKNVLSNSEHSYTAKPELPLRHTVTLDVLQKDCSRISEHLEHNLENYLLEKHPTEEMPLFTLENKLDDKCNLDDYGNIVTIQNNSPLQPFIIPVVTRFQELLMHLFSDLVQSLYLYGSAARREAHQGVSDIDITIIFTHKISDAQKSELEKIKRRVLEEFSYIPKIDTPYTTEAEVLKKSNLNSWGFWLKHCCCCIYGSDLSQKFPLFKPSRDIAEGLNGDIRHQLRIYHKKINEENDSKTLGRYAREIAKKLIRSTYILTVEKEKSWFNTIDEYQQAFRKYYPDQYILTQSLYTMSVSAPLHKRDFIKTLETFGKWLLDEITLDSSPVRK